MMTAETLRKLFAVAVIASIVFLLYDFLSRWEFEIRCRDAGGIAVSGACFSSIAIINLPE